MSDIAIRVENIGKRYRLGARERNTTLRESIMRSLNPFARRPKAEDFWALKGVNLEIRNGEAVGVIGRNGAGKSTLLKILSRITQPTTGRAVLHGRIGALLEVGTGFHPELTGRDNIFLNGAVLGMTRAEVLRKFDEIVAFAEVSEFLDTPVKHYSSGMYVRLAFAVAAHLEPEILIIDEVLAVGDASFQRKCLGKMDEVAKAGRTVLFVSHNMGAVKALTNRCVWIDNGTVREVGAPDAVVDHYLRGPGSGDTGGRFEGDVLVKNRQRHDKYLGRLRLTAVQLRDGAGRPTSVFSEGSEVRVELTINAAQAQDKIEAFLRIRTMEGQLVCTLLPGPTSGVAPGDNRLTISFSTDRLVPGHFQGDVVLFSQIPQDNVAPAFQFELVEDPAADQYRGVLFGTSGPASPSAAFGLIRVASRVVEPPTTIR